MTYCKICNVNLSHLESMSGYCVIHKPDQQPSKTPSVIIDGTVQEIIDLRIRIGLAPWATLEQKALSLEAALSSATEVERLKAVCEKQMKLITGAAKPSIELREEIDLLIANSKALARHLDVRDRTAPGTDWYFRREELLTAHNKLMEQFK